MRQQWDGIVATEGLSELDDDEVPNTDIYHHCNSSCLVEFICDLSYRWSEGDQCGCLMLRCLQVQQRYLNEIISILESQVQRITHTRPTHTSPTHTHIHKTLTHTRPTHTHTDSLLNIYSYRPEYGSQHHVVVSVASAACKSFRAHRSSELVALSPQIWCAYRSLVHWSSSCTRRLEVSVCKQIER